MTLSLADQVREKNTIISMLMWACGILFVAAIVFLFLGITHECPEWVNSPEHTERVMADEQERGLAALRAELKAHHEAVMAKWRQFEPVPESEATR